MTSVNVKELKAKLDLDSHKYYEPISSKSALKQGNIIYFPCYEAVKEIRVFAHNVPITLHKESDTSKSGISLKKGEFDIYDYFWMNKEDELPIPKWQPNSKGLFKRDAVGLPHTLNGSSLMLARGKCRPVVILSDIKQAKDNLNYPENIIVLPITSYKNSVITSAKDILLLPPFPNDEKQIYNCVCLGSAHTIHRDLCTQCNPRTQLTKESFQLIINKFTNLLCVD